MSTLEELDDLDRRDKEDKKRDGDDKNQKKPTDGDADMKDAEEEDDDILDEEILGLSTQDIQTRKRLLENDSRIMKSELSRLSHEKAAMGEKIKENLDKIANNRQLPYLVGNVVELLDLDPTAESSEEGANIDLDATRVGKSAVIKTSTRQTIFLPLIGLVDADTLKPGDLIGVNKDSYLILDTLPAEYDSRVKAMEVDEKPTEQYTDVGGLDKQIEELVEAIVWPMKEAERFKKIGIKAPKGESVGTMYRYSHTANLSRCTYVWATWYWQDAASTSLCSPNRCYVLEAGRTSTSPDVYWRRCQACPRLLCTGQGEGSCYHFY
jgi:26S proteasome regulatory subunit T5